MIDLLKRPEGGTVEQIAAAIGWQHHTIRDTISGAQEEARLYARGDPYPRRRLHQSGANGGATTYRILE
jgi:uncharacterized protein DUF3489